MIKKLVKSCRSRSVIGSQSSHSLYIRREDSISSSSVGRRRYMLKRKRTRQWDRTSLTWRPNVPVLLTVHYTPKWSRSPDCTLWTRISYRGSIRCCVRSVCVVQNKHTYFSVLVLSHKTFQSTKRGTEYIVCTEWYVRSSEVQRNYYFPTNCVDSLTVLWIVHKNLKNLCTIN